ncbi:hypothetical protein ABIC74_000825 [Mucilaginibacter rubeus]|uniref:hypothetical protein n=1 Tax=Mucilaginibacter rubeus TaxID=2027860 RepID=UPI0033946A1F
MKNKYPSLTEFVEQNNLFEDETTISFLANNVMVSGCYQGSDSGLLYFGLSPYSNGAATGLDKIKTFEIVGHDTWYRERFNQIS